MTFKNTANILSVKDWIKTEKHAHDWSEFISAALQHEGIAHPSTDHIKQREDQIKAHLSAFGSVNAFNRHLDQVPLKQYDVVSANFVAESISFDEATWKKSLDSLLLYLRPGGLLSMTAIRGATYWKIGEKKFPAFNVDARLISEELTARLFAIEMIDEIDAEISDPEHPDYEGYDGMVFVLGRQIYR